MAIFFVTEIIDGKTIRVNKNWNWDSKVGNLVKISGYRTPNIEAMKLTKTKLERLIKGKLIKLKNATMVRKTVAGENAIFAHVFLDEIDISQYFPELPAESS
ncbi:MAG: hypothetical protein ACHQFW_06040 [Chitinophagales bacterium]